MCYKTMVKFYVIVFTVIICFFGCDLWIAGSSNDGYRVEIETKYIHYQDLQSVENDLKKAGYKVVWKEKTVSNKRYPNEIYSLFRKALKNKETDVVDVYISYVKDEENMLVMHPWFLIENWYKGGIIVELKNEIDFISELIYSKISTVVDDRKVSISRYGKVAIEKQKIR